MQPAFLLASASSICNRSFRLGEPPHNLRAFLLFQFHLTNGLFGLVRSNRSPSAAAYPENRTSRLLSSCEKPISFQFSLWSHSDLSFRSSPRPISISKLLRYRIYTADLSPGSLPGVLLLSNGILILEVGFTLRCLQRLSRPHFASQLCRWHDNSCTSDASIPVLSY